MSYKMLSLVVRNFSGPRYAKPVLEVFADMANDSGVSWPSAGTVARITGLSSRRVREIIALLEDDGWLNVIGSDKGGRSKSVRRQVNIHKLHDATKGATPRAIQYESLRKFAEKDAAARGKPCDGSQPKRLGSYQEASAVESQKQQNQTPSAAIPTLPSVDDHDGLKELGTWLGMNANVGESWWSFRCRLLCQLGKLQAKESALQ